MPLFYYPNGTERRYLTVNMMKAILQHNGFEIRMEDQGASFAYWITKEGLPTFHYSKLKSTVREHMRQTRRSTLEEDSPYEKVLLQVHFIRMAFAAFREEASRLGYAHTLKMPKDL